MAAAAAAETRTRPGSARGIAVGYLALLPLLLAYEWADGGRYRNVGERIVTSPLLVFGRAERVARLVILLALGAAAIASEHRSRRGLEAPGLLPRLWRVLLEGAVAALLLGPTLLVLLGILGALPSAQRLGLGDARPAPGLETAAFLAGGAAWEEIAFRIGVLSLGYLVASRSIAFLTEDARLARAGAEIVSVTGSAAVFAAAHLAVFTQVLGPGGEAFDPVVFTWRFAAGMLLGALFRWRGPGVAAWAHALFNLFLAIGAGPGVFL